MIDTIWTDPVLCPEHGCAVRQDSEGTLDCMGGGGIECLTWADVYANPGHKIVVHRANGVLYVLAQNTYTGSST